MADQAETKLPSKFAVGYFLGIREKKYDAYIQQEIKGLAYVDLLNGEATEYLKFGPDHIHYFLLYTVFYGFRRFISWCCIFYFIS